MTQALRTLFLLVFCAGCAWASGFNINEAGARATSMGNAVTGQAQDASTLFYNPAGIGFLDGTNIYGAVTLIAPQSSFVGAAPLFDNTIHNTQDKIFPPVGLHISHRFNDKFAAGLSLSNPFGLGVFWEEDFPGRFISREVDLKSFYISPVVAYRASEEFSFGLGLDIVLAQVSLTRNILGFGSGGSPGTEVGEVELKGNSKISMGFTASMLYKGSRGGAGIFYRHNVKNEFEDADANFTVYDVAARDLVIAGIAGPMNEFGLSQSGSAELNFPSYLSAGVHYMATDKLGLALDGTFFRWSVNEEIPLRFENPALDQDIPQHYDNSMQLRIGAEYELSEAFALRAGYIHDQTPQPIEITSPLLPDDTRNNWSGGIGYKRGNMSFDLGYMYVGIGDRNTVVDGVGQNENGFDGVYTANAHLYLLGFGYSFNQ